MQEREALIPRCVICLTSKFDSTRRHFFFPFANGLSILNSRQHGKNKRNLRLSETAGYKCLLLLQLTFPTPCRLIQISPSVGAIYIRISLFRGSISISFPNAPCAAGVAAAETVLKRAMREAVVEDGRRPDGRGIKDTRLLTGEV